MKKPKLEVRKSDVMPSLGYRFYVNDYVLTPRQTKEAYQGMMNALIVAKERMNNELEHLDTNDLFVNKEQYESFVDDIEIVNKALKKAGCHD